VARIESRNPLRTALDLLVRARNEQETSERRILVVRAEWALQLARLHLEDQDLALGALVAQPRTLASMRRFLEDQRRQVEKVAEELRTLVAA
jgi:hypothetical protein